MTLTRRQLLVSLAVALAGLMLMASVRLGPLPPGLLDFSQRESTRVLDRRGELLYEARADDGSRAEWLSAGSLPPALIDATIAAEDHRFWHHAGIDPLALLRAAIRNVRSRRIVEGGSTISQQVAKLLLARQNRVSRRRGLTAKAREAVLALRLEHHLSKREILALYLNLAPYGNQLAGAERASRAYFGHDAALLTPAQTRGFPRDQMQIRAPGRRTGCP